MKALILKNRVVQVVEDADVFPVHKDLIWIDCDNTVKPGHVMIDDVIQEDPKEVERRTELESDAYKHEQEMPALNQKIDAIFDYIAYGSTTKLDAVKAKIDQVNKKYPNV